jgi:hypothetical protein
MSKPILGKRTFRSVRARSIEPPALTKSIRPLVTSQSQVSPSPRYRDRLPLRSDREVRRKVSLTPFTT